jgi:hypothetical protein
MKKLHAPVHAPPSGLLATTLACLRSSSGNNKENWGGRGEEEGRKSLGEGSGEKGAQLKRLLSLPVLITICDLECHPDPQVTEVRLNLMQLLEQPLAVVD